jgi:putative sterol carrier protein
VVQYLSDEWLDEAGAALAASDALRGDGGGEPVVLQYDVTGAPGGKCSYALRLDADGVHLERGAHKDASATFTLDYDVAAGIAQGSLSAQAAFMQGRLKLGGDSMVLVRQMSTFEDVDDALADLRGRTEY